MKPVESDRLDAEERRELSSSDFGIPEERAFPMPDAAHVRAAEAYFRYASDDQKPELARNILEKAAACRESCGAVLGREIVVV